jgi:hypothetical protein
MWTEITKDKPEQGVIVNTKIIDEHGERNEAKLKRQNNLWFLPDGSMYVYYTPTHYDSQKFSMNLNDYRIK